MDVPSGSSTGPRLRAVAWPALLLGGWWAMAQGRLTAGALAISLPFLLFWHGHGHAAVLAVLGAHLLLAWEGSAGRWRMPAFLLPLVPVAATLGAMALLRLLAGPGSPS